MKIMQLHRNQERGLTNQGWLLSKHTFSFGDYYHPEKIHFGALRVINDDYLAPDRGSGSHPHSNMEIITVPLEGELENCTPENEITLLKPGDIHIISAGDGIFHNLRNISKNRSAHYLQLWVMPRIKGVKSRMLSSSFLLSSDSLTLLVAPDYYQHNLSVYQDFWLFNGHLNANANLLYRLQNSESNGVYIYLIEGEIQIHDMEILTGDGIGLGNFSNQEQIEIKALKTSRFLLMEVKLEKV